MVMASGPVAPFLRLAMDTMTKTITVAKYKDSKDFEEMWSGSWTIRTIPDGPSYVTLNLSRVGGKNYGATDGPMYLCETYPLLISPSGTELLIGAGESGICLPFMSQSTLACVLTQSAG